MGGQGDQAVGAVGEGLDSSDVALVADLPQGANRDSLGLPGGCGVAADQVDVVDGGALAEYPDGHHSRWFGCGGVVDCHGEACVECVVEDDVAVLFLKSGSDC